MPLKRTSLIALALLVLASPAEARHRHHRGLPWCGLYMMQVKHKTDRRLALAREWAKEGVDAGGPGIGVIVVWPHHVGEIVGQAAAGGWIVHSGNDGGRVRTRARSLRGVIAYRRI